jgi:hypothetical protein
MNAGLELTQEQREAIRAVEVASFEEHCKQHGHNIETYAAMCLEDIKQHSQSIIDNNRDVLVEEGAHDVILFYERLASATDFWNATELLATSQRHRIIDEIVDNATHLPINQSYLTQLALDLRLIPPARERPETLRDFLLAIPVIEMWGYEFGAYLEGRSTIYGLPCICVFHHLGSVSNLFFNVVMPVLFQVEGETIYLRAIPEISTLAAEPGFTKALKGVLDMLYGVSYRVEIDGIHHFQCLYPHLDDQFFMLSAGAQDFVWFHEYGHLLLGHLTVGACQQLEYEADRLASSICAEISKRNGLYGIGMIIIVMMLMIMETQEGTEGTPSHPMAAMRLLNVLGTFEASERSALFAVVNAVQTALNPALRDLGYKTFFIFL